MIGVRDESGAYEKLPSLLMAVLSWWSDFVWLGNGTQFGQEPKTKRGYGDVPAQTSARRHKGVKRLAQTSHGTALIVQGVRK